MDFVILSRNVFGCRWTSSQIITTNEELKSVDPCVFNGCQIFAVDPEIEKELLDASDKYVIDKATQELIDVKKGRRIDNRNIFNKEFEEFEDSDETEDSNDDLDEMDKKYLTILHITEHLFI
ncbi:hypothetical protein Glove_320g32 [Diversispora epigaea]|uniref:Uncharacterized protein n=1 Tax=Diversispora epigaea TaxID=1348612 RepID=A0A397HU28_9GLOM|nr:hypothetical protein Glove_320g32 [Diversispora epigaea]